MTITLKIITSRSGHDYLYAHAYKGKRDAWIADSKKHLLEALAQLPAHVTCRTMDGEMAVVQKLSIVAIVDTGKYDQ